MIVDGFGARIAKAFGVPITITLRHEGWAGLYYDSINPWKRPKPKIRFAYCILSGERAVSWSLTTQNATPEGLRKLHEDSEEI